MGLRVSAESERLDNPRLVHVVRALLAGPQTSPCQLNQLDKSRSLLVLTYVEVEVEVNRVHGPRLYGLKRETGTLNLTFLKLASQRPCHDGMSVNDFKNRLANREAPRCRARPR